MTIWVQSNYLRKLSKIQKDISIFCVKKTFVPLQLKHQEQFILHQPSLACHGGPVTMWESIINFKK